MLRGKSALPEQAQPSAWLPHSWEPSQLPARLISRLRAGVANVGHLGRLRRALVELRAAGLDVAAPGAGLEQSPDLGAELGLEGPGPELPARWDRGQEAPGATDEHDVRRRLAHHLPEGAHRGASSPKK